MKAFSSFEEVVAWQKARKLAQKIFKLTREETFNKDLKLRFQMNGSSGSIMDNIAEGFGRDGNREFIQFLWISKGSATELKSQLYRCLDREWLTQDRFSNLYSDTEEVEKLIAGLIKHLSNMDNKGRKYR